MCRYTHSVEIYLWRVLLVSKNSIHVGRGRSRIAVLCIMQHLHAPHAQREMIDINNMNNSNNNYIKYFIIIK